MKKIIVLFTALLWLQSAGAQSLTPTVIASGGDYFSNSTGSLSWTLGETMVDFLSTSSNSLSQGFQQTYSLVTGVEEPVNSDFGISVFPNPAKDIINITLNSSAGQKYRLCLVDMLGRVQWQNNLEARGPVKTELNMYKLTTGMYFLHVYSNENQLKIIKIQHFN